MNILVTGANGQLGNAMRVVSAESADRYIFTDVAELDITDREAVMQAVTANNIGAIVNCAAYTNVDKAEDDEPLAELLNATAVAHLAEAAKAVDAVLFHVSTDYVFGGTQNNTPIAETEPMNPSGAYGRTKLHGEEAIERVGCKAIVIRTAWLYSKYGANFVKTMLNLTATRPQIKVVVDQVGTPTYAGDLAEVIFTLIEKRSYEDNLGTYHYSNEGAISWYDFAQAIARGAGHTACDIQPCRSSEFPSKVTRPAYSVLDKTKIKQTFGITIPYWEDSLTKCLSSLL
ncbi:MAG: dTDP-4-dehydrorhamnose reductase [Rikenellaceae bacterium]|jgi:dTDP-4-dehydrorhamnose reductase|nr:dTDP-4-dehydrorhamnose reductase [Rikenellaceae bacterium]